MATKSDPQNTVLRLWLLLHRVRDVVVRCEDSIFSEYGITYEQFTVLGQVKGRGGSPRMIDLAQALECAPNSISNIVDRMVKAGLVRRTRGKKDRRVVHVSLTGKGEDVIKLAAPAGWEFIQKILSPISYKDKYALVSLLETLKCDSLGYLNPEVDMAGIIKNSPTNQPNLYELMVKNVFPSGSEGERRGGKKGKTI
jgi:MarR family transcriptional regulator for hemolysin